MNPLKIQILINETKGIIPTPDYCENNPVGGSVTAAIKIADILRQRGHHVEFLEDYAAVADNTCDIFISLRLWRTFFLGKRPGKVNYLWCQDDSNQPFIEPLRDPEIADLTYKNISSFFFISHFQAKRWIQNLNIPPEKIFITHNAITTSLFDTPAESLLNRPRRAYYSSTPFRGLDMLLLAWSWIRQAVPDAELLIFSSIQVYGPDEKPEYLEMYEKARSMENLGVKYIGSVGQKQLREAASQCRLLAYPCIFAETGCIAAMEAMASGCAIVSTNYGALPETAWRNPLVPLTEGWLYDWAFRACRVLADDNYYISLARQNLALAKLMDWNLVADHWLRKFEEDLKTI